jgi:hypothetical protein
VAEGDGPEAARPRPVEQEGVAGLARGGLKVALPTPVAPDEGAVLDAEVVAELADGGGLGGAVRSQAVVDGGGLDRPAPVPRPGLDEDQERCRIAAAGDRDAERSGGRAIEDGIEEAAQRFGGYWQRSA